MKSMRSLFLALETLVSFSVHVRFQVKDLFFSVIYRLQTSRNDFFVRTSIANLNHFFQVCLTLQATLFSSFGTVQNQKTFFLPPMNHVDHDVPPLQMTLFFFLATSQNQKNNGFSYVFFLPQMNHVDHNVPLIFYSEALIQEDLYPCLIG